MAQRLWRLTCDQAVVVRFPVGLLSSYLGQLSLSSLRDRQIEYRPVWLGLTRGVFTCVEWQVTLCDPMWQVAVVYQVVGYYVTSVT